MTREKLVELAWKARENAYAPYSRFKVGAAVLGEDGNVYLGGNIENASYGMTVCAERTAIFGMINAGCKKFTAIAVVCGCEQECSSCMACRQVMTEFCENLDVPVYFSGTTGEIWDHTVGELAPLPFMAFEPNADYDK